MGYWFSYSTSFNADDDGHDKAGSALENESGMI